MVGKLRAKPVSDGTSGAFDDKKGLRTRLKKRTSRKGRWRGLSTVRYVLVKRKYSGLGEWGEQ